MEVRWRVEKRAIRRGVDCSKGLQSDVRERSVHRYTIVGRRPYVADTLIPHLDYQKTRDSRRNDGDEEEEERHESRKRDASDGDLCSPPHDARCWLGWIYAYSLEQPSGFGGGWN